MGDFRRKYEEGFKQNAVELCRTSGKTTSQIAWDLVKGFGAGSGLKPAPGWHFKNTAVRAAVYLYKVQPAV